jgi:hypothetical protein
LGTIHGTADPCGPAFVPSGHAITVHLQDRSGKDVAQQRVGKPWTFTFTVVAGDYKVTAPADADVPVSVRVSPLASSHVHLFSACK